MQYMSMKQQTFNKYIIPYLTKAINEIMKYAYSNNGQPYDAIKRLYVKEKVYDLVVSGLKEKILQIKQGDPKDESTDLGPLAIPEAALTIEEMVYS